MELLHATGNWLGLVTNGEQWMLVDAPKGETTGFASWFASLWFEEPLTLRAFRTLLGVHRFFAVPDDETLEAMLKESATNQQEVTDRLGYQVRGGRRRDRPVAGSARPGREAGIAGGAAPSRISTRPPLTVMMRLVFLFSAEERGLLLLGDPLYDEHYAVSTLVAKLQEAADQHGEEVLERSARRLGPAALDVPGGLWRRPARADEVAAIRREAPRPRPVPDPRRAEAGDDVEGHPGHALAARQPDGPAPAPVAPVSRNAGRGPSVELPGPRHRADRPRLRRVARSHRPAGDGADGQPDRRERGRARGCRLGTGGASREGRGHPDQVPQGPDGSVGECAREVPEESHRRRAS